MTTNLWTVGQGLVTRRLVPKTPAPKGAVAAPAGPKRSSRTPPKADEAKENGAPAAETAEAAPAAPRRRQAQEGRLAPVSDEVSVEATGETVGEAKWKALRDLERAAPGLDKASVRFQVVSEGERGLLGVGYTPARVVASVDAPRPRRRRRAAATTRPRSSARVRELVETCRRRDGRSSRASTCARTRTGIVATCTGGDLGLLIGKHGQTIDALQYVANAALFRGGAPASP